MATDILVPQLGNEVRGRGHRMGCRCRRRGQCRRSGRRYFHDQGGAGNQAPWRQACRIRLGEGELTEVGAVLGVIE